MCEADSEPTGPGRVAARSPLPRVPSAEVRDLGKHVTFVSPSSNGRLRQCTVYNDRTWRLDETGRVNAPTGMTQILITSASSDKMDRQCLHRIAGAAVVRPTSGRFNKPCDQAAAWLQALVDARRGMRKLRNDWIAAARFMSDNMLGLLLCLRYSFRKENRARFKLMCDNYGVHSAVSLAPLVSDALFDGRLWSGVYQVFHFGKIPVYHGKFHGSESWSCWERCKNHFGQMIVAGGDARDGVQDMYRFMAKNGGLEEWFILPVLRCPAIPKSQLNDIEQRYIRSDPHCLNTQHFKGKGANRGCGRPYKTERSDPTGDTKLREISNRDVRSLATPHEWRPVPLHLAKRG